MTECASLITDPLTTISKLALLYFLPTGTKISIRNNILDIQTPCLVQSVIRTYNRDNRMEIANLNASLLKAVKWYILNSDEKVDVDEYTSEYLLNIFKYAIKGLHKMQQDTYSDDISINIILQYMINILVSAINNTWNENCCVEIKNDYGILTDKVKNDYDPQIVKSISTLFIDTENNNNKILELTQELNKNRKDISLDFLKNEINKHKETTETWINCIHKLLNNRDNNFVKHIKMYERYN